MVSCPETLNKVYYWFFLFSSSGFLASVSCFFAQQFDYDVIIETYQIISFFPNGKSGVFLSLPAFFILSLWSVWSLLCFAISFSYFSFSFLHLSFLLFFRFYRHSLPLFTSLFSLNLFVRFFQPFFVRFSLFPFSVLPSSSVDLITRPNIFLYCLCWYR